MVCFIIAPILTELFNKCIFPGIFSDVVKVAQITPIFEKGTKTLCSNYQPISLLPSISKIFEKCLYSHLYNFLI